MKRNHKPLLLLASAFLSMMAFISFGFNTPADPEHPLFVSYEISVGYDQYNGPDLLLTEIKNWIEANSIYYDVEINYSTGAVEEFAHTDAEAIQKFDAFVPKFKAYLNEVYSKLSKGSYEGVSKVNADFYVYAKRAQGQGKDLKSEHVNFVYPAN